MHEINSQRLAHLVALAEEGSFARAAERVHLSQPALSRSIQALEDEFDIKLFDRAARGVATTAAGRMLVERARRVLFEARCLFRDVELIRTDALGEMRIGMGPYAAAILFPDLLVECARQFPATKVSVQIAESSVLMQSLRSEGVDFVVIDRRETPAAPDITTHRLLSHDGGWFVRPGHPLLARAPVPLAAVREFPLVSVPLSGFMEDALRRLLKFRAHEAVPVQLECNDVAVLKDVVARSDAVMFCTASLLQRDPDGHRLVRVSIVHPRKLGLQFALVCLADRTQSAAVDVALALAGQIMNDASRAAQTAGRVR
ncbi:LysR family transcriptional regulator [Caballeronia udeis]|uniref:LysR family transcriptional regulator n=1 Tax=Caballeronia udeis TaxID=1232866 RepID=A0A158I564_9BURK|nr:LysR family transcriptional regulator [Caballeronia udeis]SAL51160.1 LysR family transcriptional regulator [Caballeronia udeis]